MRKLIVGAMISLDGVMLAPGGPEEDPTGGFKYGGWVFNYFDDALGQEISDSFSEQFDLLLGRKTYDIFAAHWPHVELDRAAGTFDEGNAFIAERFNAVTKYVATHRPDSLDWVNSESLGNDVVAGVRALKKGDGPALLTQGSTELLQTLFRHDLVDELRLLVFPLVLGRGKRLFGDGAIPAGFRLTRSSASQSGALIARYERDGEVRSGSFAAEQPSEAELERRRNLK
ncbi:MAG TPA: dihydrofolate reductase family protein [Rhizobiaceae bacterium]|nr:dihydrofolate reductase family protein [Rhizobiaceae bacterium]